MSQDLKLPFKLKSNPKNKNKQTDGSEDQSHSFQSYYKEIQFLGKMDISKIITTFN